MFDDIKTVVKEYVYNQINILYYINMPSEEKILLKDINNKYINNYNRNKENRIKNQIKLLNMDEKNKREFFTNFGDEVIFLFIDEKLIISFLESLPKEYGYNIELQINVRGYGNNDIIKLIEVYPDDFDFLLEKIRDRKFFNLNFTYPKIYN
jgi:hypothetical protein